MNGVLIAVILSIVIVGGTIGISAAPPPNAQEKIVSHVTNDNAKRALQTFDISHVEKGSQITSTNAVFDLSDNIGDECVLVLNEPHLNKDEISDHFVCGTNNIIPLKTNGNHALQSMLNSEQFSIEVKSINSGNVIVVSNAITLDISYLTPTTFAQIENGIVTNVIIADQSFVDSQPGTWVKVQGVGVGYSYDSVNGIFIPPQPFPSWTLVDGNWQPPVPFPLEPGYNWNEADQTWDAIQ